MVGSIESDSHADTAQNTTLLFGVAMSQTGIFRPHAGEGGATRSLCPYMEVPNVVQSWACVVGGRITIVGSLSHAYITRESTLGYVSSGAM